MKEERRSRLHLTMHQFQPLERFVDPFDVSALLLTSFPMIDAAHAMRSLNHLEASILPCRAINSDQATCHLREQAAIGIPVTVILMPFPCSAQQRLLEHHFVVIMINFSPQQLLHWINDAAAADKSAVDVCAQRVSDPQLAPTAGGVQTLVSLLRHLLIDAGDPHQQIHLLGIEQFFDHQITISIELLDLFSVQLGHALSWSSDNS